VVIFLLPIHKILPLVWISTKSSYHNNRGLNLTPQGFQIHRYSRIIRKVTRL